MNLDQYVKETEQQKKRCCVTCNLPDEVLEQVEWARSASNPKLVPFVTICKWLKDEHGVTMARSTLRGHFEAGHQDD